MKRHSTKETSVTRVRRRVFLVDDHPMMRAGLAGLIQSQPDLEVVGEAADAPTALEAILSCQPDLVLSDLTLPGRSGIDLIKDLLASVPTCPSWCSRCMTKWSMPNGCFGPVPADT